MAIDVTEQREIERLRRDRAAREAPSGEERRHLPNPAGDLESIDLELAQLFNGTAIPAGPTYSGDCTSSCCVTIPPSIGHCCEAPPG